MSMFSENALLTYLDPGERLIWSGQPVGGLRLRPQDVFLIPFSLLWGGFAIFWEVMAVVMISKNAGPAAWIFPLFGLPFVAAGLYLIFGRFFVDARIRARTFYGLTNERVIILRGLFSQELKSLPLRTLSDLTLTQRRNGTGTITFGPTNPFTHWMPAVGGWPGMRQMQTPAFELVECPRELYDMIRAAQREAGA